MPVPPNPPCKLEPEGGTRPGVTYETIRHINKGQMANAYEAKDSLGKRTFLKAYISPTPAVEWYNAYITYVRKLNQRIASSTASGYCAQAIDTFEAKVGKSKYATFFQVYEFVDGGNDLESILKKAAISPGSLSWGRRVSMAKVMLSSLNQLHDARIVHCDLKPPNIIMEPVEATIGFRPKLIDLDSSILADVEAPWHGMGQGYVGSPNYYSPEHFKGKNSKPLQSSDVFTSALILFDLLGQGNPYRSDDPEEYNKKVLADNPPPIRLKGRFSNTADEIAVTELLKKALSSEPSARPTMKELHLCLLRVNVGGGSERCPPPPPPPPPPPAPSSSLPPPPSQSKATHKLMLAGDKGNGEFGISTAVGRTLLDRCSSEWTFASEPQFELVSRAPDWFLKPLPSAKNATAVNGTILSGEKRLSNGDTICLIGKSGRRAMELSVIFK